MHLPAFSILGGIMTGDLLTNFVSESRRDKGARETLLMKKVQGTAGFCIRAKGGSKAIKELVAAMNQIDLSEHRQEDNHER